MRIIHLTDPHLSSLDGVKLRSLRGKRLLGYQSWYRNRRHKYQRHALDKLVASVHTDAADLIIVTGDLVHIGLETEFTQARDWLEILGPPTRVRLVPGNHDCYHPSSWQAAHRAYSGYLAHAPGSEFDSKDPQPGFPWVEQIDDITLIGANSAHPAPWWGAIGTLGDAQRARLAESLAAHADAFRILALHHPPLPNSCSRRKALTDAQALQTVMQNGQPHITLHGHLHHNSRLPVPYGYVYCTASASSVRPSVPASYRRFDIARAGPGWQVQMTLKSLTPNGDITSQREDYQLS